MDNKPAKGDGGLERGAVVGAQYCLQKAEEFKMENAICTKDWSITNANGKEVYRVRGKRMEWGKPRRELVDVDGNTIVVMKQKRWSWIGSWRGFHPGNEEQRLWTIRKSVFCSIGPRLQIFLPSNTEGKIPDYTITGEKSCKKCTIFCGEQIVAEVVREASFKNVFLRKSIFHVLVQPGIDMVFVFSLLVIMDKFYIHYHHIKCGGRGRVVS